MQISHLWSWVYLRQYRQPIGKQQIGASLCASRGAGTVVTEVGYKTPSIHCIKSLNKGDSEIMSQQLSVVMFDTQKAV